MKALDVAATMFWRAVAPLVCAAGFGAGAAVAAPAGIPPEKAATTGTPKVTPATALRPDKPRADKPPQPARSAPAPFCATWSRALPNVSRALCDAAALVDGGAQSVQGAPLLLRDVPAPRASDVTKPAPAPLRVLVVGGIHGDELSSAALALHWIALAQQQPPPATPRPIAWRFVPLLNPDGLLHQPPRRMNYNGVDLNRNFPTPNWAHDAPVYWEKRTRRDPRRYPGPTPLSEPESRFLHAQMQQYAPDLIVSIHAPYGVLDFDGPSIPPSRLGRLYLDQVGIFPGSLGHYGGVHKGIPVVTIELPNAQRTPLDAEMRQMWLDLLRWTGERLSAADPARR